MSPDLSRLWRGTAIVLRVICFILLLVMFSFKLVDFLHRPVVSETRVMPAAPPTITVCPADLNRTALWELDDLWSLGILSTEEVLHAAAGTLQCVVLVCQTADGDDCSPPIEEGGEERCRLPGGGVGNGGGRWRDLAPGMSGTLGRIQFEDTVTDTASLDRETVGRSSPSQQTQAQTQTRTEPELQRRRRLDLSGRWKSLRVPPGLTCHTLDLSDLTQVAGAELQLTLLLQSDFLHPKDGFYRLFFHGESSPKTWYGLSQVSAYSLVLDQMFKELVVTQSETVSVDRGDQPCQSDPDYDRNQCLLDCRSLAAFTESNCSVLWGATSGGGLPACVSRTEYEAAVRAWQRARPDCDHCLRPCRTQLITVMEHPAMTGVGLSPTVDIQLRFSPERLSVRQRLAYELVDLLSDLGGAFGLLLGYSLMSLVDLLDAAVGWNERRRRRRAAPGRTGPLVLRFAH